MTRMETDEITNRMETDEYICYETPEHIVIELKHPRPYNLPEPSQRQGHYEIYVPNATADSEKSSQPSKTANPPTDEIIDSYSERLARHRGEVSEKEIEEAKPEVSTEPLADYRFWEEVNRRRDAESEGKPLPQWIPCGRSAEAPDTLDLFHENSARRASEAIGQKADAAESQAHRDLMAWAAKRKAQNK